LQTFALSDDPFEPSQPRDLILNSTTSLDYLDPFIFCGLCFRKMTLEGEFFSCPTGCIRDLSARSLEEILWKEMGRALAIPEIRALACQRLGEALSKPQLRRLFKDLRNFVEFLPTEEKQRFSTALVEKVDVLSSQSVKIQFRS